jgi:hypothetical protein
MPSILFTIDPLSPIKSSRSRCARPPSLFVRLVWNRNHRTDPRLAPQQSHQRAQQHIDINNVRLRPPRPTIDGKARGLHHVNFNVAPYQKTRQPKSIPACLMGQNHPRNRMT